MIAEGNGRLSEDDFEVIVMERIRLEEITSKEG